MDAHNMMTRREMMKKSLLTFGALSAIQTVPAKATPNGYGIQGQLAPELNVDYWIDKEGKKTDFKISDHEGKWIFLKGFQSWCPGCHAHGLPTLKKISAALAGNPDVVFAAIQTVFEGSWINTVDKVRETQLQYDLQLPMGHDTGGDTGRSYTMTDYRTGGTPWMILINPERQVIYNDFSINADKAIEFLKLKTAKG